MSKKLTKVPFRDIEVAEEFFLDGVWYIRIPPLKIAGSEKVLGNAQHTSCPTLILVSPNTKVCVVPQ